MIRKPADVVEQHVRRQARRGGVVVDRFTGQQSQNRVCHFSAKVMIDLVPTAYSIALGWTGNKFLRTIHERTEQAELAASFSLVKDHVKERRKGWVVV